MKKYAVLVAGGAGTRMNAPLPKQFLMLDGKPVLYYTIKAFLEADADMQIILVLPEGHIAAGQEIIDAFFDYSRLEIAVGGRTRFHSVQNGLKPVKGDGIVLVHDAVRCLLSKDLINRCTQAAGAYGSAVPVTGSRDSVRIVVGDENEALERNRVKLVQTPQAFLSNILLPAFAGIDFKEKFTDEATVVEAYGIKVHLVEGEPDNIKITTPLDLVLAGSLLKSRGIIS